MRIHSYSRACYFGMGKVEEGAFTLQSRMLAHTGERGERGEWGQ